MIPLGIGNLLVTALLILVHMGGFK
jgi:hypothetical protein